MIDFLKHPVLDIFCNPDLSSTTVLRKPKTIIMTNNLYEVNEPTIVLLSTFSVLAILSQVGWVSSRKLTPLALGIASDNLAKRAKNFVQPNHHE